MNNWTRTHKQGLNRKGQGVRDCCGPRPMARFQLLVEVTWRTPHSRIPGWSEGTEKLDQNHRFRINVEQSSRSQTRCGCRIRSHTGHMLKVSCSFGPRAATFPACLIRFLVYEVRFFCTASSRPSNSPIGCCLSIAGIPPVRATSRAGVGNSGRSNRDTAGPSIIGESRWKLCRIRTSGDSHMPRLSAQLKERGNERNERDVEL